MLTVLATKLRQRPRRGEDGNMAVTMIVLMIIANLCVVSLTRTLVTLHQIRNGQDFAAGLADADGGMSDALFQIDQGTPPTITGSGTIGGRGAYRYLATRIDADTYDIKVKGTIGNASHAIEATVGRTERFPYAVFSNQGMTLNDIFSFDTPGGTHTGKARVGSNHAIVVNSGAGGGDFQDYFAPSGSCSGCANPVAKTGPYTLTPVSIPTGLTQACPAGGVFTGSVQGSVGGTTGVPYICDQNVTLQGTVTVVDGPVVIYITANHSLSMSGAVLNQSGRSTDLQIYKDGTGAIDPGNGSHAVYFNGILYAPGSDLTFHGGETYYGSLTLNSIRVDGNPNFTVGYDGAVASILSQNWRVRHWHEVPSNSVGF